MPYFGIGSEHLLSLPLFRWPGWNFSSALEYLPVASKATVRAPRREINHPRCAGSCSMLHTLVKKTISELSPAAQSHFLPWVQRILQGRHTQSPWCVGTGIVWNGGGGAGLCAGEKWISQNQVSRGEAPGVLPVNSIWEMDQAPPLLSLLPKNTEFSHLCYGFAVGQRMENQPCHQPAKTETERCSFTKLFLDIFPNPPLSTPEGGFSTHFLDLQLSPPAFSPSCNPEMPEATPCPPSCAFTSSANLTSAAQPCFPPGNKSDLRNCNDKWTSRLMAWRVIPGRSGKDSAEQ